MAARRWGRVINVLNYHAKAPQPGGAPMAVTRAAGHALTKVLAGEYAPQNVLVNAMMIGAIRSSQWERLYAREERDETYEEFLDDMATARHIPIGRIGEAEEFANLACFIASDAASYITCVAINIDGGSSPVV